MDGVRSFRSRVLVIQIDGIHMDEEMTLVAAIGVDVNGDKHPLGLVEGATENAATVQALIDNLVERGLDPAVPRLFIIDGSKALSKAIRATFGRDAAIQRCQISADYKDMIYAGTKQEIETKRKAFIRKWRLKCKAVADSLEEAGDKLFTFTRFPKSQWKSIRTSNAIERLHEEFKRRIKTQTVLPSAETAAMLFWALLASGQITMRKVDGWQSLAEKPSDQIIDLAA